MGHYKIWLCRCGFSLCVSPPVLPFFSLSSNRPLALQQGSNGVDNKHGRPRLFTSLCSSFQAFTLVISLLSFTICQLPASTGPREEGVWAPRRGSRRHWAQTSPRDQPRSTPRLSLLPFSSTLQAAAGVPSLLGFTP